MRRALFLITLAGVALGNAPLANAAGFRLLSPDIKADGLIPKRFEFNGFGCSGANVSPALKWRNAPKGAKSFAVTVYDPDAPSGSGWWHWMVINIPARTYELRANAGTINSSLLPAGAIQSRNDFGANAWGGVCPPPGDKPHRYVFTVYALKVEKLALPADATAAYTGYMINRNSVGRTSFTARYGRKK